MNIKIIIIIICFISVLFLLIGDYFLYSAKIIKNSRIDQITQTQKTIQLKEQQLKKIINQYKLYENYLSKSKEQLEILHQQQNKLNNELKQKQEGIEKYYNIIKQQADISFNQYENNLENYYEKAELKIKSQIKNIQEYRDSVQTDLDQLKNAYQAATAARLLEEAEQDKWRFYSIHLTDNQTSDIAYLQTWKHQLHDPSIVSKIIWSSYYIKPVGDMCNRILGTQKISGVYKLTDKSTGMVYIGQSVNVADRWKTHIKYGLGIDTPITPNKLYQAMQNSSLWYWTFELLEECPKDKLNKHEKFWIDFYQSDKIGLNSKGGNKGNLKIQQ